MVARNEKSIMKLVRLPILRLLLLKGTVSRCINSKLLQMEEMFPKFMEK